MSYKYTAKDKRVLAWCNTIRVKLGKKPVRWIRKGDCCRPQYCALAQTIGDVRVGGAVRDLNGHMVEATTPNHVMGWIRAFDRGDLPHFIQGEKA